MTQKHLRMIVYKWVLLVIVAILANGCRHWQEYVDIEYIPEAGVSKVDGADFVEVSVKLTDVRTTKDKVSCKKTGAVVPFFTPLPFMPYGQIVTHYVDAAAIISNDDVATLVANAIEDELRNRGFKITEGGVQVDIELNKFYNDFKVGSWSGSATSVVIMNVKVKRLDGNINYVKSITGLHTVKLSPLKTILLYTGKNAKMTLEVALKDAVSKLMHDSSFIAALVKEAELDPELIELVEDKYPHLLEEPESEE